MVSADPQTLLKRLRAGARVLTAEEAAATADPDPAALRAAVDVLALQARQGRETTEAVRQACGQLNGWRAFALTREIVDAWCASTGAAPDLGIQRRGAQALINLSALDEAQTAIDAALQALAVCPPGDPQAEVEGPELRGLHARVAKQRYADHGDLAWLNEAVRRYLDAWSIAPWQKSIWPGVNAVALLLRREREALAPWPGVDPAALVQQVVARTLELLANDPDDAWLMATMSECRLAQGVADEAELWLYRFMLHPGVDAFALDAYDRQLREIWQGSQMRKLTLADRLEGLLARHLMSRQRRWVMSPAQALELQQRIQADPQAARDSLEKNFSGEVGFSLEVLEQLLRHCAAIGCVCNRRGERMGTGFLVAGSALDASLGDAPVFVTNAHVIGTQVDKAVPPDDVRVCFEVENAERDRRGEGPKSYRVQALLYTSPPGPLGTCGPLTELLDVTVVRLAGLPPAPTTLAVAPMLPLVEPATKAYVVGHPDGGGLQISLHDSLLLDIDDVERLVHYRTPTEPGSSGSPVFNASWQVIAVHHGGSVKMPMMRGSGIYKANEGISLRALQAALKAALDPAPGCGDPT